MQKKKEYREKNRERIRQHDREMYYKKKGLPVPETIQKKVPRDAT